MGFVEVLGYATTRMYCRAKTHGYGSKTISWNEHALIVSEEALEVYRSRFEASSHLIGKERNEEDEAALKRYTSLMALADVWRFVGYLRVYRSRGSPKTGDLRERLRRKATEERQSRNEIWSEDEEDDTTTGNDGGKLDCRDRPKTEESTQGKVPNTNGRRTSNKEICLLSKPFCSISGSSSAAIQDYSSRDLSPPYCFPVRSSKTPCHSCLSCLAMSSTPAFRSCVPIAPSAAFTPLQRLEGGRVEPEASVEQGHGINRRRKIGGSIFVYVSEGRVEAQKLMGSLFHHFHGRSSFFSSSLSADTQMVLFCLLRRMLSMIMLLRYEMFGECSEFLRIISKGCKTGTSVLKDLSLYIAATGRIIKYLEKYGKPQQPQYKRVQTASVDSKRAFYKGAFCSSPSLTRVSRPSDLAEDEYKVFEKIARDQEEVLLGSYTPLQWLEVFGGGSLRFGVAFLQLATRRLTGGTPLDFEDILMDLLLKPNGDDNGGLLYASMGFRVAVACRFLRSDRLYKVLRMFVEEAAKEGRLDTLCVVGVGVEQSLAEGDEGIETHEYRISPSECKEWNEKIIRKFLDTTGDIQTLAVLRVTLGIQHVPALLNFAFNYYLCLLAEWGLVDARLSLQALARNNNVLVSWSARTSDILMCYFCNSPLFGKEMINARKARVKRAPGQAKSAVSTRNCPNPLCGRSLPRCAICLLPIKVPVQLKAIEQDSWFCWCTRCEHGGCVAHIEKWFAVCNKCPVPDCNCRCSA